MRNLSRIVVLLSILTASSTAWFRFVADWNLVDAFYMTIITLSTVGYTEVNPLTEADKLFVSGFLVVGLGVVTFSVVHIGESIVRAELGQWWKKKSMDQTLRSMKDHFIVCGAGRMGRLLCEDLMQRGIAFVLIECDPDVASIFQERNWPVICADATDDEVLTRAGIEKSSGLAAVLASDADNLYVVISARLINAKVQIVARAHDDQCAKKLQRAGANRVVSPYESGAAKMSQLLTNPRLNDFVEIVADHKVAFDLFGVPVTATSTWAGKKLAETDFQRQGVMIVAIRQTDGSLQLAPSGSTMIHDGDELFALGDVSVIKALS